MIEGYKKDVQATLKEHLGGVQRVPAMLINDQERSLEDLHLGMLQMQYMYMNILCLPTHIYIVFNLTKYEFSLWVFTCKQFIISFGSCIYLYYLGNYEVLPTEPLHDVKEHIANIVTEIVPHLSDDEKKLFVETVSLVSGTKDQLRGSDYRETSIVLAKQLRGE